MKVIIQMTDKEFHKIMDNKKFTSRKDFADYVSNIYNGGEPCDAVQLIDEVNDDKYYIYKSGDEFLGK